MIFPRVVVRSLSALRWMSALPILIAIGCSSSSTSAPSGDGGSCTAPHFTVDPADGKCKLDGTTTNVGAPCMGLTPAVCGTDQNASCLDPAIDDFPGGYCNVDPCTALVGHLCPVGASCVQLNGENGQCFKNCNADTDCRQSDGYFCLDLKTDSLWISGASQKVCSRAQLTCPLSPSDCPSAFPHCVLPDGRPAYTDAGPGDSGASEAGSGDAQVAPPTPLCVK